MIEEVFLDSTNRGMLVQFVLILLLSHTVVCSEQVFTAQDEPRTVPVTSTEEVSGIPNATISKWQYCTGCVETAFTFNRALAAEFAKFHTKEAKKVRNAYDVLDLICDSPEFKKYQPFVKYSCIKMVDEHASSFVEPYGGATSSTAILSKKEVFEKTRRVCVDSIGACDPIVFDERPLKKRDKCAACHVIAQDIERIRKTMLPRKDVKEEITETESSKKMKKEGFTVLRNYFEETFCETLGFRHRKYSWLESRCEEMVEDHLTNIVEVMDFHEKLAKTGFAFGESLPQRLCDEIYKCGMEYKLQYDTNQEL